ncbi:CHAT domain-containing protein [Dyadobacter sp. 3J3]|uniref:CHAT domain-containing protein n=1 Tax=Dyadobacter sp. 3J3 TaxID=2606600 RepID=UPI00135C7267|nr:CHAT domain-containing protein [Dyadobacter sp. 3J3]
MWKKSGFSLINFLLLSSLLLLSTKQTVAQCPDFKKIWLNVSQPLDPNIDDPGLAAQDKLLSNWYNQWKSCGAKPDSVFGLLLQRRGVINSWTNRKKEALQFYEMANAIFSKPHCDTKISSKPKIKFLIGECYLYDNDYVKAESIFEEIVRVKTDPGHRSFQVKSYLKLAYISNSSGDYEKALSALEKGILLANELQDPFSVLELSIEKIFSYQKLARYSESNAMAYDAIRLAATLKRTNELISTYEYLATNYSSVNKTDSALYFFNKVISICDEQKQKVPVYLYTNMGVMYFSAKQYDKAVEYYIKSLLLQVDPYHKALVNYDIALATAKKKEWNRSLAYFDQAFQLLNLTSSGSFSNNPPASLMKIAARKEYLLSMVMDKGNTLLSFAKDKNQSKATLRYALKTYMLADTMIDYMRWEHTGKESKLFWRNITKGMYERAIETCFLLKDPETAFYFFEKSRAVMLNDQLNELGANQRLNEKDAERERIIRRKISDLQDQLSESKPGSKSYAGFRNDLYNAQEEQQIFIKKLEKENPQYYSYKYDNHVPGLEEVREKVIPDGQNLISYFVGDSAVYGLSISGKNVDFKKIKLADYQKYTAEFQKLLGGKEIQNKQFAHYLVVSNKLYELLIKPFEIQSNRVIISPDGNFLPFESLSFSAEKADFLVTKYAFSYTYSASFLVKMKRSEKGMSSTNEFLGMAPVRFSKKLNQASLPGSEIALEAINKHFFFSKSLTGVNASRGAFMKELSSHSIIQLLTHASADSSDAEPTLYFADSTLTLSELSSSVLSKTQLLVLSACRTGVGKNQKGEGVFSLARGFAGIGIPSTLTTLWSVENKSIYELTELFYDQLKKGVSLDIALQQAQIEWLKTASKSDQLPYSWAGMVLVGNVEPVDMGLSKNTMYILIASIAGSLVLLGFYLKKRFFKRKLVLQNY